MRKVRYNEMKKAGLKPSERWFLLAAAVVCAASVALAFWFAAPSQADAAHPAADPTPLVQLMRVDLNTADAAALCTLPGVGEKRAQAILDYRREHGPFVSVEEAAGIPGLTEEIVASWSELAYVS